MNKEKNDHLLKCPRCGDEIGVDSVREYKDKSKKIYWECRKCNLSVMERGK